MTAKDKPYPSLPGKAYEVPEVVVDLLPEREAEQLAATVMRQEEEERQTEFYSVLSRLLDQKIPPRPPAAPGGRPAPGRGGGRRAGALMSVHSDRSPRHEPDFQHLVLAVRKSPACTIVEI